MNDSRIDSAVSRAVGFLESRQLPHGELRTLRAQDRTLADDPVFESSPYGTTYVIYSLGFADDPRIAGLTGRALDFLAEEMEPPGLWRYYSSRSAATLPPDLDDTACAAFALRHSHDEIQLGLHLRVILANRDPEGRFLTFLTDGNNNVDAVVNANLLCYLGEREETRAACEFLCDTVSRSQEEKASLYGVDDLSFYYVLSRAFSQGVKSLGACRGQIVRRIAARQRDDGSFGDELATALAVASFLNFGDEEPAAVARAVRSLLDSQGEDGSWPRSTFYVDFSGGFYGSEELTTAFAVESLARAVTSCLPR
ncbi:MAG: hypothetical protein ACJ76J_04470 [Thermoanaerobaculia bacterium]